MPDIESQEQERINLNDPKWYINRELSSLDFQRRVLDEAKDPTNPLLERIKFLAIVGSNIDEFFMVRVGGLKMQNDAGVVKLSIDGQSPAEQLAHIRKKSSALLAEAREYYFNNLQPELHEAGIHILDYQELNEKQKEQIERYFENVVFPVLTPLAFDPGHPFPHISNLSVNLAILIKDEENRSHFARIKVPDSIFELVPIKRSSGGVKKDGTVPHHHYFVWIDQVISANLHSLFPGMEVIESYPFRVTRNADLIIQELEASDLLETMEESVRRRRFGAVIRLDVNETMPTHILEILVNNLKVNQNDVYPINGPLALTNLMELHNIDRYDLKYPPFMPSIPNTAKVDGDSTDGNIFSAIRRGNFLLHHPYDSFNPVIEYLKTASKDPNVLAIKQTLYRVGKNSPIVDILLKARRDYGKQVAVLVELKARFDEESNIGWAKVLEQEGVHVTYGLVGLKTHSKVALVVRKEGEQIRRYIHLGTGNYNHVTAQLYEDMGMFTCDDDIGADATDLFNSLTGYSAKKDYRKLLVAPINLRERIEELIMREAELHKNGVPGHIIFKMNSLTDKRMIKSLYKASQAGVSIDLIVRGLCSLRPGIKGLSENIKVISIVGRFLEHSRIYYFQNGGEEIIYMGSADIMPRNLNNRVEVLFPVSDQNIIRDIRDKILETYLSDNVKSRLMLHDGNYSRVKPAEDEQSIDSQEWFIDFYQLRGSTKSPQSI
jgi:polyphosphate kinase